MRTSDLEELVKLAEPKRLHFLSYENEGQTYFHWLEGDILGVGGDKYEAADNLIYEVFDEICLAVAAGKEVHFYPAPKKFFDRWEAANMGKPMFESDSVENMKWDRLQG